MKRNKKTRGLLAALAVVATAVSTSWSASDSIVLLVTPQCNEVIVVSAAPEPYNFGSIAYGLTTHSTRAISVSNTGSCQDTWDLQVAPTGGGVAWTADTAPGTDVFSLSAKFTAAATTTQPATSGFDANDIVDDGAATPCTASKFDGDATCIDVPAGGVRNLWFKLALPLASTDPTQVEHTLTVTVTTAP